MKAQWLFAVVFALVLLLALPSYAESADEHAGHGMSMSMVDDPCFAYNSSCYDCTLAGCNYCQKIQGTPNTLSNKYKRIRSTIS